MPLSAKRITALLLTVMLLLTGCGRDRTEEAQTYTAAILALMFQGETQPALEAEPETDEQTLAALYAQNLNTFVEQHITSGLNVSDTQESEFTGIMARIFQVMRYSVTDAEKTGRDTYEVSVEIHPADTFVRFSKYLAADSEKVQQKKAAGEYSGSDDEIQEQILSEIAGHAQELLEQAFEETQYGDKKVQQLKITEDGGSYSIDEDDMNNLMIAILRLDEI